LSEGIRKNITEKKPNNISKHYTLPRLTNIESDTLREKEIVLIDGTSKIKLTINNLEDQLAEQGIASNFLPYDMPYFAFWSTDRNLLLHGHELREQLSKKYEKLGHCIRG